ncbi:MAG: lysylphosphatidylglycerol synthase transmembrane domain-containing protein [Gammaproteobacteria bacterium]
MATKRRQFLSGLLISALFVLFIEWYLGWKPLLKPWLSVEPIPLGAATLLLLLSYTLRSIRLYHYFGSEVAGRFTLCLRLMLQHNLYNNLLPMRSGELSFPILMQRYFSITPIRSVPALMWFRILDLHTLGLLALPTLIPALLNWPATLALCALWLLIPPLIYLWQANLEAWLVKHRQKRVAGFAHRLTEGLPRTSTQFFTSWGWTLANWSVKLLVFAWILRLFLEVPWLTALLGVIGGELTSVLPVHGLAGMGTYEAGIMAALLPLGIVAESALHGAVNLHLFLLAASLIGGMLTWLIPSRSKQTESVHGSLP